MNHCKLVVIGLNTGSHLSAMMALPVLDNHLLGGVNELTCCAFPRQTIILSFHVLETPILRNLLLPRCLHPLSIQFVRLSRSFRACFRILVEFFVVGGGRLNVAGGRDLSVRPHVHVVLQRGGCLDRRHHSDWNRSDVAMLVANMAADVAAEVGTIRARRAAESLQLLRPRRKRHRKQQYESVQVAANERKSTR